MKKFSFEINGGEYEVHIKSLEGDIAELEVNGTPYSVNVKNISDESRKNTASQRTASASKAAVATPQSVTGTKKSVKSPLPGSVIKVNVAVGQAFNVGETLLIREWMKKDNNILAESSGVITKINVNAGQAVLQDEVLFEYSEVGGVAPLPVAAPAPAPKPQAAPVPVAPPAPANQGSRSVKSPLPGSVIKVNVAAGQAFREGDTLLVMESMKMENNILAENSGTITKVCVTAGQAVLQDEVLFEYN
jgi:biotin carboxyl carrier protein